MKRYVVMAFREWGDAFELENSPLPFTFKLDSSGFLEVFDTRELAETAYPRYDVLEIESVTDE